VATVDGWKVVVKKGEFTIGDLVVYLEIDSWVPHDLAPFLSREHTPREYNGVAGERLRTIKLRGQVSQGLILNIVERVRDRRFVVGFHHTDGAGSGMMVFVESGDDVTEALNIQKWEKAIPAEMQGLAKGTFPSFIPKTDQERIQNCFEKLSDYTHDSWEISLKLDGTSCTIWRDDEGLHVAGRNMEIRIEESTKENVYVKQALKYGDKVELGFAFQGEIMGPGVQGNREKLSECEFFIFDIFDIQNQAYLLPDARWTFISQNGLVTVPILDSKGYYPTSVENALEYADGASLTHKYREGLVWKNNFTDTSFKVISNKFLLKGGD